MIRIGTDAHDTPWYVDEKTVLWLPRPIPGLTGQRVVDLSPAGNHGRCEIDTSVSDGAITSTYTSYSDNDSGVNCGNSLSLAFSRPVTVAAWIRDTYAGSPSNWGCFLSRGADGTKYGWRLIDYNDTLAWGTSAGWIAVPSGTWAPRGAGWHHHCGTYDGTTIRLYRDGVDVTASTGQIGSINFGIPGNNTPLYLCARSVSGAAPTRQWSCDLADIVIANRAYPPDRVAGMNAETRGNY